MTQTADELKLNSEQRIRWNRVLLDRARGVVMEAERRAGPEPIPGIDWKAWHDARAHRQFMMEAIDDAEVRMERDPQFIIGPASGAGWGSSRGFDPETGARWRQSRDGGPAFAAVAAEGAMRKVKEKGCLGEDSKFKDALLMTFCITVGLSLYALLLFVLAITGVLDWIFWLGEVGSR